MKSIDPENILRSLSQQQIYCKRRIDIQSNVIQSVRTRSLPCFRLYANTTMSMSTISTKKLSSAIAVQQRLLKTWKAATSTTTSSPVDTVRVSRRTFATSTSNNPSAKLSSTSKFNDLEPIGKDDNMIPVSFKLLLCITEYAILTNVDVVFHPPPYGCAFSS
jgi:hypothetical protein